MKLINIIGLEKRFEYICSEYLLDCNIHLENVTTALGHVSGLVPYQDNGAYPELIARMDEIFKRGRASPTLQEVSLDHIDKSTLEERLSGISIQLTRNEHERQQAVATIAKNEQIIAQLKPLLAVDDVEVDNFFHFDFVKFRFGKMPKKSLSTLEEYLNDIDAFFIQTSVDDDYVWGMYFMPFLVEEKIDAIFQSLYFERTRISDKAHGTPIEASSALQSENEQLHKRINELDDEVSTIVNKEIELLNLMYSQLQLQQKIADIRHYAGHTNESFYIVGWMNEHDVEALEHSLRGVEEVVVVIEEPSSVERTKPPTLLRNNPVFRPFEMFVRMYGTPSYNELDPTPILAITYILMFGAMFGDVGQGALLAVFGFIIAKWKKSDLAAIIGTVGISSIAFGFVYGSVFGHEDIIHGILEPMKNMNEILIGAVAVGAVIVGMSMILNIANGIKTGNMGRVWFSQNGVAGIIFYFAAIYAGLNMMNIGPAAVPWVIGSFIAMPLLVIFIQEPLAHLVEKKKDWMPKEKGMFIVESFFELFEIVLSYITNTMSFIRVGAFALNHVGMMSVVFVLAKMAGSSGDLTVQIIGNLFVMGLEGLIVGIQVLRLEFYEMFSRFFIGDGKEFKSFNENN